jgi:AcrR family transcriptional regulator
MKNAKSETTAARILEAALALFRDQGFDAATMRAIAERAGMATGAAYYYYPSKDAIIMDFYQRACDDMQPAIGARLAGIGNLEQGLAELVRVKLDYFSANRDVLRALLRNGADPRHPLSPFSRETSSIRDLDISWFQRLLLDTKTRVPRDLAPHLPRILWFFQMGLILFWVTDDSPGQRRTAKLVPLACRLVASLVRLSSLPLMRPLRKPVLELVAVIVEE